MRQRITGPSRRRSDATRAIPHRTYRRLLHPLVRCPRRHWRSASAAALAYRIAGKSISMSRKKRKRDRRRAEATAEGPILRGGWGRSSQIRPRDLLLIRQAIREGWATPPEVAATILNDVVGAALESKDARLTIAACRVVIDAAKDAQGGFDRQRRRRHA